MDCLIVDDEEVSREIVQRFVKRTQELTMVGVLDNALDAYQQLSNKHIDILFLDIEMPEMTGIELVKSLEHLPQVILITGRKDFAAEAFDYNLTDYLVKPINYFRFLKAVDRARRNLNRDVVEKTDNDRIYIKANGKIIRLKLRDIFFIEALSDYVIINTERKRYIVHTTMKKIAQRLCSANFVRIHRSYIVNIASVETIDDMQVYMLQKPIPIGASYKAAFFIQTKFLVKKSA